MKVEKLAIIIPCYNEQECIEDTTTRLIDVLSEMQKNNEISEDSFLFWVDDGSFDNSWRLIEQLHNKNPKKIKGLKFTKNYGNQKAILAGLFESCKYNPDCFLSIDADLQQDEFKIKEFVKKFKAGAKIVAGIRNDRNTDNFFKKFSALTFYKIMNLLGVKIKVNHSDYRLVSREAVDALYKFKETNLFLRGIFNELGFKMDYVHFDVKPRKFGKTKYGLVSLISLALSGITSFSIVPLRIVSYIGILMSFVSFLVGISAWWEKVFNHTTIPGWATIIVTVGFVGGIQILCIGIIGEYLGQLFQEVKARPRYIVEKELD